VAEGRPTVNVPPYDGGLFLMDPAEALDEREQALAEFLLSHSIPDRALARAIDRLARDIDEKTHGLAMIDYKSLGVRQLGSIYEGLLEFKLRIASTKMAICSRKSTEVILPYAEAVDTKGVKIKRFGRGADAEEQILRKGSAYLENDKHERKATGSYYTPEYIVEYIVEHTVGPVLEEKLEALREDLDRACGDFLKLDRSRVEGGMERPDGVLPDEEDLIERIFDMRVLDPAMGSGHFLVTAVDFIADRMIHFLNGFPGNPVDRLLQQTRREIIKEVERRGISIDERKLTNVNLLKRHVLKRCIHGVDLNPMAVELAKVSLWLHCFTLGAPLSFLDHHLKCGNSLIGEVGTAEAVAQDSAQATLDGTSRWHEFSLAVQNYLMVSRLADATASQVLQSRRVFREAEKILDKHRAACNVLTAGYFVEPKSEKKRAVWVGKAEQRMTKEGEAAWEQAQESAGQHRFFHWPLQFPEVWYGIKPGTTAVIAPKAEDEAGFDAVIGNPPWGVELTDAEKGYARLTDDTTSGPPESYRWFMSRTTILVSEGGYVGMIVPNTWLSIPAAAGLRRLLHSGCCLQQLVQVPPGAFHDVNMNTIIFAFQTLPNDVVMGDTSSTTITIWQHDLAGPKCASTTELTHLQWSKTDGLRLLLQHDAREHSIMGKLRQVSQSWRDHLRVSLGAQAYHNSLHTADEIQARIYHSPYAVDASYMPELSGSNVHRYYLDTEPAQHLATGDWLYLCPEAEFLAGPRILVLRVTGGRTFRLQACFGDSEFVPYKALLVAALRPTSAYCCFYPLSLLNARIGTFFHHHYSEDSTQELFPTISIGELNDFPIRQLDLAHPSTHPGNSVEGAGPDGLCALATAALRAHAIHHGPAGKPELRQEYLAALDSLHPHEPMPPDIPEDPADFPGREDFVHDLLAMLAQRMMDLNKEKYEEIQRFLDGIEQEVGCDIEDLSGKTYVKAYYEHDFERLEATLKKNKRHMRVPVEGLFAAQLRDEYETSTAKLRPIEEALQKTDWLIDQIVYRLYGLTNEEVAIVEESFS